MRRQTTAVRRATNMFAALFILAASLLIARPTPANAAPSFKITCPQQGPYKMYGNTGAYNEGLRQIGPQRAHFIWQNGTCQNGALYRYPFQRGAQPPEAYIMGIIHVPAIGNIVTYNGCDMWREDITEWVTGPLPIILKETGKPDQNAIGRLLIRCHVPTLWQAFADQEDHNSLLVQVIGFQS